MAPHDTTADADRAEGVSARQMQRDKEHEDWEAYWKIRSLEAKGNPYMRLQYSFQRYLIDKPVTWWRRNVAEPLQEKYKMPYYHRRLSRAPEIDECTATDYACIYEANEQFRLDKLVDLSIMKILHKRLEECVRNSTGGSISRGSSTCAKFFEEFEENDLNFFIKYGELGVRGDVRDAYMKQKHRMIWERRHPHIMEQRAALLAEHKQLLAQGIYEPQFWRLGHGDVDGSTADHQYQYFKDTTPAQASMAISKDWEYYKKMKEKGEPTPDRPSDERGTSRPDISPVPFMRGRTPRYMTEHEAEASKTNLFKE